jgi:ribokinase
MASRFGIPVTSLGQIGDDIFGEVVLDGLQQENVDTSHVLVEKEGATPLAGIVVDPEAEPAYLGISRGLDLDHLPEEWEKLILTAEAVFADGWAEHQRVPDTILPGFQAAQQAGIPVFFDPGPGNPDVPSKWILEAINLTDILLVNEQEALQYSAEGDRERAIKKLLTMGPEMVVLKLGADGITIHTGTEAHHAPGFPVKPIDQTGAGDSVTGAIIYGWLNSYNLADLGSLANATGAAKVKKRGTGRNLPNLAEIKAVLIEHQQDPGILP